MRCRTGGNSNLFNERSSSSWMPNASLAAIVFSVASGLDLAAPGTGGVPVRIGKLVVILGRGVNDREPQAFTILGVNQDGLRDMRDVAEAITPGSQPGDISQKFFLPNTTRKMRSKFSSSWSSMRQARQPLLFNNQRAAASRGAVYPAQSGRRSR